MFHKILTLSCATLVGIALAGPAAAHGPVRLKSEQSVVLNAPVDQVWAVVGTFGDMSWFPGTTDTKAEGDTKGALRTRTWEGHELREELMKIDPAKYAISTRFVEDKTEALKATNYASHITLAPQGEQTKMTWRGAFYRAFPQNEPPADLNDDASTEAVIAHHQRGIDALVERFGAAD